MSEENKTVELEEDEFLKVSGGYSLEVNVETYEVDDCFKSGLMIYVITQASDSNSNWVYFDNYSSSGSSYNFAKSDYYPPEQFKSIRGEYIGKKNSCGYTFTGK